MRFLRIEAVAGVVLFVSTLIALVLANTRWVDPFLAIWATPAGFPMGDRAFSRSLQHWINDGLMTFFFFAMALELKRQLMLGELRSLRMSALPLAAALGGMIVPAGLFVPLIGSGPGLSTDTAFVVGSLTVLGSRIPQELRLFLLSLAGTSPLVAAFGWPLTHRAFTPRSQVLFSD